MNHRQSSALFKKMTSKITLLSFVFQYGLLASPALALERSSQRFVLRQGDTLSRVAQCLVGSPVYPHKTGSLRKILEINQASIKIPNRIYPGQEIILPQLERDQHNPKIRFGCDRDFRDWVLAKVETSDRSPATESSASLETQSHGDAENSVLPSPLSSPIPEQEDLQVKISEPAGVFKRYTYLSFSPQTSFIRLDGKDKTTSAKALVFSDLNVGGTLQWTQVWSPGLRSFAVMQVTKMHMREAESGYTITGAKETYSGFGGGLETNLSNSISIGGGLYANQEMFYRSTGLNAVALDKVTLLEILTNARWIIIDTSPLGLGLDLSGGVIFPGKTAHYKTSFGNKYSGKIYVEQALGKSLLGVGFRYSGAHYSSSIAEQTRTDLGFELGWTLELGK